MLRYIMMFIQRQSVITAVRLNITNERLRIVGLCTMLPRSRNAMLHVILDLAKVTFEQKFPEHRSFRSLFLLE